MTDAELCLAIADELFGDGSRVLDYIHDPIATGQLIQRMKEFGIEGSGASPRAICRQALEMVRSIKAGAARPLYAPAPPDGNRNPREFSSRDR